MDFEASVPVLLTLLAFAMITERIMELLKKAVLPFFGRMFGAKSETNIPSGFWGILANLNTRMSDQPAYEEKREQIIIPLSVLVGIGLAGICWTEIEVIFKSTNITIKPWLGSILAGILFSFGSKFWHDVLDLVLAIKNIRRNLADANVKDFSSAAAWSAHLNKDEKALAEAVIHEEKEKLMRQYPSALVELSPLLVRNPQGGYQYLVAAYFQAKRPSGFPDYFRVPGSNTWIATKYFEDLGMPRAQRSPGYMVRNIQSSRYGSFGCLIKLPDETQYILTCAHVIVEEPGNVSSDDVLNQTRVQIGGTNEILHVFRYEFGGDKGFDFALIGPVDERYSNAVAGEQQTLKLSRKVSALDENQLFTTSLARSAAIIEQSSLLKKSIIPELDVIFQDETVHRLKHLIRMDRITEEGDSGSVVYDAQGDVIGMVVAADEQFTYLLNIQNILSEIHAGAKIALTETNINL